MVKDHTCPTGREKKREEKRSAIAVPKSSWVIPETLTIRVRMVPPHLTPQPGPLALKSPHTYLCSYERDFYTGSRWRRFCNDFRYERPFSLMSLILIFCAEVNFVVCDGNYSDYNASLLGVVVAYFHDVIT